MQAVCACRKSQGKPCLKPEALLLGTSRGPPDLVRILHKPCMVMQEATGWASRHGARASCSEHGHSTMCRQACGL